MRVLLSLSLCAALAGCSLLIDSDEYTSGAAGGGDPTTAGGGGLDDGGTAGGGGGGGAGCNNELDCAPATPVCDFGRPTGGRSGTCVECLDAGHCDVGEQCNRVTFTCESSECDCAADVTFGYCRDSDCVDCDGDRDGFVIEGDAMCNGLGAPPELDCDDTSDAISPAIFPICGDNTQTSCGGDGQGVFRSLGSFQEIGFTPPHALGSLAVAADADFPRVTVDAVREPFGSTSTEIAYSFLTYHAGELYEQSIRWDTGGQVFNALGTVAHRTGFLGNLTTFQDGVDFSGGAFSTSGEFVVYTAGGVMNGEAAAGYFTRPGTVNLPSTDVDDEISFGDALQSLGDSAAGPAYAVSGRIGGLIARAGGTAAGVIAYWPEQGDVYAMDLANAPPPVDLSKGVAFAGSYAVYADASNPGWVVVVDVDKLGDDENAFQTIMVSPTAITSPITATLASGNDLVILVGAGNQYRAALLKCELGGCPADALSPPEFSAPFTIPGSGSGPAPADRFDMASVAGQLVIAYSYVDTNAVPVDQVVGLAGVDIAELFGGGGPPTVSFISHAMTTSALGAGTYDRLGRPNIELVDTGEGNLAVILAAPVRQEASRQVQVMTSIGHACTAF